MTMVVEIMAFYDPADDVWCGHGTNLTGLFLESPTLDMMMDEARWVVPKLLRTRDYVVRGQVEIIIRGINDRFAKREK